MENVKNRMNLHLTVDQDNAVKWLTRPTVKDARYMNGLFMIENFKDLITYDKPIYVGCSVLDLSKLCMMEFHYEVIQENFKGKANLIYSDTDSLVYNIEHPDIYEWIRNNPSHFDLSDSLRPDLKSDENKKKLGKFKDELNSLVMSEFISLNPKVYSFNYSTDLTNDNFKNKKTLKGVSKPVVKNEIDYEDYLHTLNTNEKARRKTTTLRSFNHQIFTYCQTKIALTSSYDKMLMVDSINCLPFGFVKT